MNIASFREGGREGGRVRKGRRKEKGERRKERGGQGGEREGAREGGWDGGGEGVEKLGMKKKSCPHSDKLGSDEDNEVCKMKQRQRERTEKG